jgi:hypothetical protein
MPIKKKPTTHGKPALSNEKTKRRCRLFSDQALVDTTKDKHNYEEMVAASKRGKYDAEAVGAVQRQ